MSMPSSSDDSSSDGDNSKNNEREKTSLSTSITSTRENLDGYAKEVKQWTLKVPIGMGLCPWAGISNNRGLLRVVTCEGGTPEDVVGFIRSEIESLTNNGECVGDDGQESGSEDGSDCSRDGAPPLSTTLVVCPHVSSWNDFLVFDKFVRTDLRHILADDKLLEKVTLVSFHPKFLRWCGLPDGLEQSGEIIQSHWGIFGKKSVQTAPATIMNMNSTNNKDKNPFGRRKVKIKFRDVLEGRRQEQFVPTDWIVFPDNSKWSTPGPPLPDNLMHRAPYPTVHIIVNKDLASLCVRDISRVKRRNAQRMMRLDWKDL